MQRDFSRSAQYIEQLLLYYKYTYTRYRVTGPPTAIILPTGRVLDVSHSPPPRLATREPTPWRVGGTVLRALRLDRSWVNRCRL